MTGRSASEPTGSLVTYLEMPTLWSKGEGRCCWNEKTEAFQQISRGSRGGRWWKRISAEREIHGGGGQKPKPAGIRQAPKSCWAVVEIGGVHSTV